ncbi:mariner Mos1 transposase [Elysia marginata]|uniref:Mariner Mos1 transposase n=1 Tax=Elysia marginata TaxID=1093978 RepID=A0AAV4INX1_9GAST|nr:mariner Mos1 transposase [Elysia marginata]
MLAFYKSQALPIARNFLWRFQTEQKDFLGRIITGDETWVYSWDPETKQQSAEWRDFDEPRPEKARRKQGALKVTYMIFFDMNGVILRWPVPIDTTISAQYYKKVLQDKLRPVIRKKRPGLLGVRHLVSTRQCASPYGPGSDRRLGWLQVRTAGASSLFT